MTWLAVFAGGGIGSLLRYGTGLLTARYWSGSFPLATLLSNFAACLILGIGVAAMRNRLQESELLYAFVIIGICGGYSTFSTFARENLDLLQRGSLLIAGANILLSLVLCMGVIWIVRR